ncbi:MAG TPA: GWxTD domain-containing protein [Bacteroidota bacterium]
MIFRTLFSVVLLMPAVLQAQERIEPRSAFGINFDYARFSDNDSSHYLELYFACYPQLVTLRKTEGRYAGYVEIRSTLRARGTDSIVAANRSLIPISVPDTSSAAYRNTLVGQLTYSIPAGPYDLSIVAIDSFAVSRRDSFLVPLDIPRASDGLVMSDVELCSAIRQSSNTADPFYKNSHEVVPNPGLLFGAASNPVIFHYVELYNLNVREMYTIKTVLADARGTPISEHSRKRKFGVERAVDVGTTAATKLPSGKYHFQIVVLDSSLQAIQRTEKVFYAYNPGVVVTPASQAEMMETELSGLTAEELGREFEYARYLATREEIDTFSEITSPEGRREFLARFWSEVAQGKAGYEPISRSDYLLRAQKTNDKFRGLSREGWKTDRGRVYLLYSEPDEIERRPSSESGKPYEIWSYYQIENGVTFIFVDRTGFGDYTLVHSTKRGELRDDNWQRLLQ